MRTSPAGIQFVEKEEGSSAVPYKDGGGVWTIGVGHVILETESFSEISKKEIISILSEDLVIAETCVNNFVREPLNQNEFDALVSLVFNIGCNAFKGSTLLKLLNAGDFDGAANQFPRWCKDNGKKITGLLNRRLREKEVFLRSM